MPPGSPVNPIYHKEKILKLKDFVSLQNALFVKDYFDNELPKSFKDYFKETKSVHNHETRSITNKNLSVPSVRTVTYGKESIRYNAVKLWNHLQNNLTLDLTAITKAQAKNKIKNYFIEIYQNFE